jgi:hypothetical protein
MFFVWVKKALHPILYLRSHTITPSMMEPVLSGISGKGKVVSDVKIWLK